MLPRPDLRLACVAALAAAGLALSAQAQPWETAPPPTPFLRPLAKPAPVPPSKTPAEKAPAQKAPAQKAPAQKAPAPKAPPPKAATPAPKAATPAPRPTPAPAPAPRPAPAARPAPAPAVPRTPVIIIDSREIADPQTGVRQLARISEQLTAEFAARAKAMEELRLRAEKAKADLAAARTAEARRLEPTVKAQVEQYEAETRSFEAAYNARSAALVGPVQQRVNAALQTFANARGATVVIDGAQFNESVLMLQAGLNPNTLDLTRAFIDGFNAANP